MGGNHGNSRDALHVEHTAILPFTSKSVYEPMVPFAQYFRTSAEFRRGRKIAAAAILETAL